MASAKDLLNKSGGGGFFAKPAATPLVPPADAKDKAAQPHGPGKPVAKHAAPGAAKPATKAGGSSTPTSVRPKV
ncbi:MAG: hypothetical protein KIT68_05070 [Phycisphaeraceae bacterium]|nr:hypothetical protein [Phycisphaeraceae bacterium]